MTTTEARSTHITARWPTAAAVAVAALTLYDVDDGATLAPVLVASGLVYLGAAAVSHESAAWPTFGATFVLIAIGKLTGIDATGLLLGIAGLTAVAGLVYAGIRPAHAMPLQLLGMAVAGGIAAVAIAVVPTVGAFLVAAGLVGHAAWDVHHHRTGRVVSRSFAEFCLVVDTLLAIVIVVVTVLA
jgi:hypothetical protein